MKEIPFSPYDFFGYIASGLTLVILSQLTLGFPNVLSSDLKPFDIAITLLAVYIAGQIVAGPAKAIFEDTIVHKVLGSPTKNLLGHNHPRLLKLIFPGFYTPLPAVIRARIAAKLAALELSSSDPEGIFLTIRYSPEVRSDASLIAKINLFRDQYGFNRNVSFSLFFAAVCFAIAGHMRGDPVLIHYSLAAFITAILLFYRFLKFYRQYSFELFNC